MPRKRRGKGEKPLPEPEQSGEGDAEEQGPQVPCPHGSHDGQACCAMECHVADVRERLADLVRRKKADDEATLQFFAKLKGATMNADGEVTVALIPNVTDPWGLHHRSVGLKGRSVTVTLLFEPEQPATTTLTGQQALGFEGPTQPQPVDMIVCATCKRIDREEGAEPGRICRFCADGELQIVSVIPLYCSTCKCPQELATAQAGDFCTLCTEGRYLAGDQQAPDVVQSPADLIRFIPPSRTAEFADAVCGLSLQSDLLIAKAIVAIGDDRYVVTEACSADPVTFEVWEALPMDAFEGEYHADGSRLEHLRVTLPEQDGVPGAAFVLVGPPLRVIVQPEDEPASDQGEEPREEGAD